jgi:hypothetical protein
VTGEPAFTISHRTGWDPQGMEPDRIRAERDAYEAAGVSYVVAAPWRTVLQVFGPVEAVGRVLPGGGAAEIATASTPSTPEEAPASAG